MRIAEKTLKDVTLELSWREARLLLAGLKDRAGLLGPLGVELENRLLAVGIMPSEPIPTQRWEYMPPDVSVGS